MKLVLVASLAAVLGTGMSGNAEAHGYPGPGGSIFWADENVVIGLNYGVPIVRPYYAPPRYVYKPRVYRHDYHHGKRHHYKGHHDRHYKGYHKGYYKGYKHGHRHDRHHRHGHGH